MYKNLKSKIVLVLFGFSVVLTFQNCAPAFDNAADNNQLKISSLNKDLNFAVNTQEESNDPNPNNITNSNDSTRTIATQDTTTNQVQTPATTQVQTQTVKQIQTQTTNQEQTSAIKCPAGITFTYHDQNYPPENANYGTCTATTKSGTYNPQAPSVVLDGMNLSVSTNSASLMIGCGNDGRWYGGSLSEGFSCSKVGLFSSNNYKCVELKRNREYNLGTAGCDGKKF